jgi:LacI family transcriptional regulator
MASWRSRSRTVACCHNRGVDEVSQRGVTLHDVAREAGVSYATASRALNGSARSVRPENLRRVRAAASSLGYLPNIPAQSVARGSTSTVALVMSEVDDPYFSAIAAGVTEAAERAGLIVTMAVTERSPELELRIVRTLRGQRPRAVVIAGSRVEGSGTDVALAGELAAYRSAGGRVALISQHDLPFPTLVVDNRGGARRLAVTLATLGYATSTVVRAPDAVKTSRDRVAGFHEGLRDAGLPPPHEVVTDFTRAGGRAAARELAGRGFRSDEVVFAVTDIMAVGVMSGLREAGIVPGRDVAVAGFDDIDIARDVTPALTSVHVPLHELGRRALALALGTDDDHEVPIAVDVVLRESTPRR